MLKIEALEVSYGAVKALRGISMEVNDGEIVSLIGANGAGKSSTLRAVSGLVKPSAGRIFFEGDEGDAPLAKYYTVSYMLEHPAETIMIYIRSIRMWISTWFYQSLGRGLAGVTLILPMTVIRVIIVLLVLAVLQADNFTMSFKMRGVTLGVCVIIAMLVLTTMLTGWTRRDDIYIQGMQGRYFCPLLPYFFSILSNKKLKIKYNCEKSVIFTIICIMLFVTVFVLSYTFVN